MPASRRLGQSVHWFQHRAPNLIGSGIVLGSEHPAR
jgi:hypothetical protein